MSDFSHAPFYAAGCVVESKIFPQTKTVSLLHQHLIVFLLHVPRQELSPKKGGYIFLEYTEAEGPPESQAFLTLKF